MSSTIIKDVIFHYARLAEPTLKYKAKAVKDKPWMNKEYTVNVVLKPSEYQRIRKEYKKVKFIQNAKTYDADEYRAQFNCEPQEGYENADGEYTVLRFTKSAFYINDEKPTKAPTVIGSKRNKAKGIYHDNEGHLINNSVLIGNGSIGDLQFRERTFDGENGAGLTLDLVAVCVRKLVPYIPKEKLEFDVEDDDDAEDEESTSDNADDSFEVDDSDDSDSDGDEPW